MVCASALILLKNLLLSTAQDTGRKFISQTTVAIKSKVPNCPQFFFWSPLQKINLLGAGAVAVFFELGVSGIQPGQAHPSNPPIMPLEYTQAELSTDLEQFRNQKNVSVSATVLPRMEESVGTAKLTHTADEYPQGRQSSDLVKTLTQQLSTTVAVAPSLQVPTAPSVVVPPSSTPVRLESSVEVDTQGGTEPNERKAIPAPVLAASRSNSSLERERSLSVSQSDCATDTTCNPTVPSTTSVVHPNRSTPVLAQLPSFSPTPAPVGVNNSSNPMGGQIPYFPQPQPPVPMPAMVMPMGING